MNKNLRVLIYTALMTAFVFITTSIIKIPIPFTNGYIHAGDMCIFISGILLGPLYGGVAAGVGSALADLLGGYAHWVIPTLIIKTTMGMIIGYFAVSKKGTKSFTSVIIILWVAALSSFIYTLFGTSAETVTNQVEELSTLESAANAVRQIKVQLIGVLIAFPVLAGGLNLLKNKYHVTMNQLVGMIVSGIWMVLGYYLASAVMYGSFLAPIFSIPWNIVQFSVGAILAFLVIAALEKANIKHETLIK